MYTHTYTHTHTHTHGMQERELNEKHEASIQQLTAEAESKKEEALEKQRAQHNQEMENKVRGVRNVYRTRLCACAERERLCARASCRRYLNGEF